MTGTFDPIIEVDLHQDSFGEKQFITVGWGKKETQFHGSEGKAARFVTQDVDGPNLNKDDGIALISWRGDGLLFAVSVVSKENVRYIRIFNREGGHYFCYDWTWVTNHSHGNATSNGAFVAVIDGGEVLLTSFRSKVTPPPMSDQKVKLLAAVNAVVFCFDDGNSACAVLADGRLAALVQEEVGGPHQVQWVCEVESECTQILHHWVWLSVDTFVCCSGTHVMLLVRDHQQDKLILRGKAPLDSCLVSIVRTSDPLKVLLQMSAGQLFVYDTAQNKVSFYNFNLPECCTKLNILRVEETEFVFGLSDRNR
uniref:Elongator complex protein 1 n=1 Tax=Timema tahoe TaxID=61484 RepID=A0A7R9FLU4_9NEOP|nr:unnamed protein product [Timema tahoe]